MSRHIFDDFTSGYDTHWSKTCLGTGQVSVENSLLRMTIPAAQEGQYADAQIDDYTGLARSQFPWRPPVRMEIRARSSLPAASPANALHENGYLQGTAGFGFWNYPFSVRGDILMLPEAVWFFYASPPSNMALVPGIPGWGWKAQVIHSMRTGALLSTLPTALSIGWGRLTGQTQPAARWLQRLSGASEALLDLDMTVWHMYTLHWRSSHVLFEVDGQTVLHVPHAPTRALGFVAWLDNQYAIATPRGELRFGTVSSGQQSLELEQIRIDTLAEQE